MSLKIIIQDTETGVERIIHGIEEFAKHLAEKLGFEDHMKVKEALENAGAVPVYSPELSTDGITSTTASVEDSATVSQDTLTSAASTPDTVSGS